MRLNVPLPPLAGIAAAIAILVSAVAFPGGPNSSDPPAGIAGYYMAHAKGDLAADYTSMFATALLLFFLSSIASRHLDAAGHFLLATVVAASTLELAATAIEMALAASVHSQGPATTTSALYQVASRLFFTSTFVLGLAVGTTAVFKETNRWQRWLAAIAGTALTIAGLAVAYPHGPLGALITPADLLLVVWAATSATTQIRERRGAVTQSQGSRALSHRP